MRRPTWLRSHHTKRRRVRDLPDYARFPTVHPAGVDPNELETLRALNTRLCTPQYERIQANRRHH